MDVLCSYEYVMYFLVLHSEYLRNNEIMKQKSVVINFAHIFYHPFFVSSPHLHVRTCGV